MRHYKTQKIEIKKLDEIICNCCGKKISVINEVPQEDIVEVEKHWGYLSKKDGQKMRLIFVRTAMTGSYLDFQYL